MDYSKLGTRVRNRRLELNLSQDRLAEASNVSSQFIGQIERAERKLSLETLVSISNALSVSVDFLLNDSLVVNKDIYVNQLLNMINNKSNEAKATAIDVLHGLFIHMN